MPSKTKDTENIDEKLTEAFKYLNEGWSITVSMNKAGFTGNWSYRGEIIGNPKLIEMRKIHSDRWNKRKALTRQFNRN